MEANCDLSRGAFLLLPWFFLLGVGGCLCFDYVASADRYRAAVVAQGRQLSVLFFVFFRECLLHRRYIIRVCNGYTFGDRHIALFRGIRCGCVVFMHLFNCRVGVRVRNGNLLCNLNGCQRGPAWGIVVQHLWCYTIRDHLKICSSLTLQITRGLLLTGIARARCLLCLILNDSTTNGDHHFKFGGRAHLVRISRHCFRL